MLDTKMLIGSKFITRTEAPERVLNPKTEDTLIDLPEASVEQIDAAVEAADRAFATWSRTTPAERSALLLKLADAIEKEADSIYRQAISQLFSDSHPDFREMLRQKEALDDLEAAVDYCDNVADLLTNVAVKHG